MPGNSSELPKVVLFDERSVEDVLRSAATACALNINTDTAWRQHSEETFADWLFNAFAIGQAGNQTFTLDQTRLMRQRDEILGMFRRNFAIECGFGPARGEAYLRAKAQQGRYAWDAVKWKIRATRAVNDEVEGKLERAWRLIHLIKTGVDATVSIGLCFVPAGWVWLTLASSGYHVACEIVTGTSMIDRADIVGYVRDGTTNVGQQGTTHLLRTRLTGLARDSERFYAEKLGQYAREGGGALSRAQSKRIAVHSARAGLARGARYGVTGAAVAANVVFMREDLLFALGTIWGEITQEARADWESQLASGMLR